MKLSIVMTVYQAESYIRERLSQLLSHDLSGVQLVVVISETGLDKSAQICKELLQNNKDAIVITQADEGLSIARNTGLKATTGDYVYFMDSDDVLLEDGFAKLKEKLKETQVDVHVGKFVLFQSKGVDVWPDYSFPDITGAEEARQVIYEKLPDSVWNVWRYVCRREFLLKHDLFFAPRLICEDVDWTPRMLDSAETITFIDTPMYGYFYNHSMQLSKRVSPEKTLDINLTALNGVTKFKDRPYGKALCGRLIRESLYSISDYCRFSIADRKALRSVINACEKYYHLSPTGETSLYLKTRKLVPLYWWSVALLTAKTLRGLMKRWLGANKAWRTQ